MVHTLAKTYRAIQQWNHYLTQLLGNYLLDAEEKFLPPLLTDWYGKYALLIGVPHQIRLLKFGSMHSPILFSPLINKNHSIPFIEGDFYELPFASGSIDLVMVPHTLELIDNPRQLLSEACRIVKPEGYIIVFGFNPYSLWGLKKKLTTKALMPWSGNFISAGTVKKWLALADFELVKQEGLLFRPPLQHHGTLYQKLQLMEWLGSRFWNSLGGIYMLMAKAKVIPLTPIKLNWKQELTGVQVSFPGPSIRNW